MLDHIHLKLLVIAAESSDPNLQAAIRLLEQIGVPYDSLIATEQGLSADQLWSENEAFYQGIVLTTGNLLYWHEQNQQWKSAFTQEQWQTLWQFEARFKLRQLVLYALGSVPEAYGMQLGEFVDTNLVPLQLAWTEAGCRLFHYLNHSNPLTISLACVYLAQVGSEMTTPLLVTDSGQTVAVVYTRADGSEILALTFAQSPDLIHTLLLGYGLINWVTRGLFVGERHVNLTIQIDDIFNRNTLWNAALAASGEEIYRLNDDDAGAIIGWLDRLPQTERNSAGITLDFAFNAAGIVGGIQQDRLANSLVQQQHRFRWINHGYTHLNLDRASYAESLLEISNNDVAAKLMGLTHYDLRNMVTAVGSGLENAEFLRAAFDQGIRFLVSDTSRRGWDNPSFNSGIINPVNAEIFCIPRHPTNLYFDISLPLEWESKYNHIYRSYWRRDLSFEEILEQEANMIIRYLLKFDLDPLMFHQANLRTYDGTHSLLSRLIDRVLSKYNTLYGVVPLVSLSMNEVSARMMMRASCNGAQIEAKLVAGQEIVLCADRDLTVPLTGLTLAGNSECYAGQSIAHIPLQANQPYRIPYVPKPM